MKTIPHTSKLIALAGEDAKHHGDEDGDRQFIHFHGGVPVLIGASR